MNRTEDGRYYPTQADTALLRALLHYVGTSPGTWTTTTLAERMTHEPAAIVDAVRVLQLDGRLHRTKPGGPGLLRVVAPASYRARARARVAEGVLGLPGPRQVGLFARTRTGASE